MLYNSKVIRILLLNWNKKYIYYIYFLFNDTSNISEYISFMDRMFNKLLIEMYVEWSGCGLI
jgi:hypothetical protein